MTVENFSHVSDLPAGAWQACFPGAYPFISHGFLATMEEQRCATPETGWQAMHLAVTENARGGDGPQLILPLYRKSHSWGEYVFDQEWAHAYQRYGLRYYPKLITAAPFTPATGPRWGSLGDASALLEQALDHIKERVARGEASSWHCLFPDAEQAAMLDAQGLLRRVGCQFHWFNRDYHCFDDFLGAFASRKRKNTRKERQAVQGLGLRFQRQSGDQLTPEDWSRFYEFYASTYYKRGHSPHLTAEFFPALARSGQQMLVDWVWLPGDDMPVAAALFFYDDDTLYGRYWGCRREIDGLHFEVCFYRGIEFAIEKGLKRFDPGAQGEHKISRGFEPVETCSYHWIGHAGFRDAIHHFLQQEKAYVDEYRSAAAERLPFRSSSD